MRDRVMERASLAARHDFDMLPRSAEIDVQPARHSELSALADMGNRMVPGVQITEPDLERYFAFDPASILTFSRKGKLLGAVAFLYLNGRGHDALILDEMNLTHPDFGLLAGRSDEVSAIYSEPRLAPADLYAQPSSADGRNLMIAIGFEPIPSFQHELWRYQRPWNRLPPVPASNHSARSIADARH